MPDFDKQFVVDCDASGAGFGAVLHQDAGPLAFFSRPFAPHHLKLTAYEGLYVTGDHTYGGVIFLFVHITTASSSCWTNASQLYLNTSGSASCLALILLWSIALAA